jgi:hypothetical protein
VVQCTELYGLYRVSSRYISYTIFTCVESPNDLYVRIESPTERTYERNKRTPVHCGTIRKYVGIRRVGTFADTDVLQYASCTFTTKPTYYKIRYISYVLRNVYKTLPTVIPSHRDSTRIRMSS